MTEPPHLGNFGCLGGLAGPTLPPLTDQPVQLGQRSIGAHRVTVWADRPARGLTRIMLTDTAGHGCGDAVLHGDTLTVTLPASWSSVDRTAATCMISRLVHIGLRGEVQR
ncbi:hypothetical protein ABZS66_22770 [Dactylosporangium sp. NPDC005572]|uniref:hypothetical protein n=1 Tax=Dactylosporangium sp. NPDC005572 TaxID=3156889 RepID=UPI0033B2F475